MPGTDCELPPADWSKWPWCDWAGHNAPQEAWNDGQGQECSAWPPWQQVIVSHASTMWAFLMSMWAGGLMYPQGLEASCPMVV